MMEKLLNLLDTNARLSIEQLAVMLNKREDEVAAQLARLEADGIIRGYKPLIDWEKTERELVTAIIDLQIAPSKDKGFDALAETITAFEEVESVTLMSGGYDLSVKLRGKSFRDVAMFVHKRLSPLDGVLSTATHFVLKTYKERGVLFTDEPRDERGLV